MREKLKATAKSAFKQLDKALDVGVQAAFSTVLNTPPEFPIDWRGMARFGWKFLKETGRETATALLGKKEGE